MQRREMVGNPTGELNGLSSDVETLCASETSKAAHRAQFIPAADSRNRRVPGLYVRNGRYYVQLWRDLGNGKMGPRKIALVTEHKEPIRSLAAAKVALEVKRHERREETLAPVGRKPRFSDYCKTYFAKASVHKKRAGTVENEQQAIARWRHHLGDTRIDRIGTPAIADYVDRRLKGGTFGCLKAGVLTSRPLAPASERTAALDLLMLRNVLNRAVEAGYLRELPKMPKLDPPPAPKRQLLLPDEFTRLVGAASTACDKNGRQLADYLQFLAFSGSREQEALRVRVADVDFDRAL